MNQQESVNQNKPNSWFFKPRNMKTSAQVATISTFVFFALNTLALVLHFNGAHVVNEIFIPIGFLISIFGIYSVLSQNLRNISITSWLFLGLSIGALARNTIFLYARVERVKNDVFKFCKDNWLGKFNLTEGDCRDIASNEISAQILSQTALLLFLFLFTYVLFRYSEYLKNPPPVIPQEFQMATYGNPPQPFMYNLPPYPLKESKDGLPPYAFPPSAVVAGSRVNSLAMFSNPPFMNHPIAESSIHSNSITTEAPPDHTKD